MAGVGYMIKNRDGTLQLPVCASCKRSVFVIWDGKGQCITCSRNETLGENRKPPEPSYSNLPRSVHNSLDKKTIQR
jgi:hypothetical protein